MFIEGVKKFGKKTKIARHFKQFLLRMENLMKKKGQSSSAGTTQSAQQQPPQSSLSSSLASEPLLPTENIYGKRGCEAVVLEKNQPPPHKKQAFTEQSSQQQQQQQQTPGRIGENKIKRVGVTPDWSGVTLHQEKGVNFETIITPSKQKATIATTIATVTTDNGCYCYDDDYNDGDDRMNISLAASAKKKKNTMMMTTTPRQDEGFEIFVDNQFASKDTRRNSLGEAIAYRSEFLSSPGSKEEQQFEEERAKLFRKPSQTLDEDSTQLSAHSFTLRHAFHQALVQNSTVPQQQQQQIQQIQTTAFPKPPAYVVVVEKNEDEKELDEYGMTVMRGFEPNAFGGESLPYEDVTRYVPMYQPANINPYSKEFREELVGPEDSWAEYIESKALENARAKGVESELRYRLSFTEAGDNSGGVSLSKVIEVAKKRLTNDVALYYLSEAISCVLALHRCGIVHGDLDPSSFASIECLVDGEWPAALKNVSAKDAFWKERKLVLRCAGERTVDVGSIPPGKGIAAPWPAATRSAQDDSSKPWLWDIDAVGLCSVAHKLLFGGKALETITIHGKKKILKSLGTKPDGKLLGKFL